MKVSVVTIVYNRAYCIADCIESVLNQTYENIEHVIIDGGSTDGTAKVIENYKEKLGFYLSEKDNGLYDALNKGIKHATGDIIGILNSDDFFYQPETVAKIVNGFLFSRADLVYGKGLFVDKEDPSKVKRIYSSGPFKKKYLEFGWIPLHTTIFVRKEIFLRFGEYDSRYKIASDYDISLRWFKNDEIRKYFLNEWIVKMRMGGLSTSAKQQINKSREDLSIIKHNHLNGLFTLLFKIARKIPQYILPRIPGLHKSFH